MFSLKIQYSSNALVNALVVTGGFDNWSGSKKMSLEKEIEGSFVYSALLPVHYEGGSQRFVFKFIVDGQWTCSPSYPVDTLEGYENNVIYISKINLLPLEEEHILNNGSEETLLCPVVNEPDSTSTKKDLTIAEAKEESIPKPVQDSSKTSFFKSMKLRLKCRICNCVSSLKSKRLFKKKDNDLSKKSS